MQRNNIEIFTISFHWLQHTVPLKKMQCRCDDKTKVTVHKVGLFCLNVPSPVVTIWDKQQVEKGRVCSQKGRGRGQIRGLEYVPGWILLWFQVKCQV